MAINKPERIDALIENAGIALNVYSLAKGHKSSATINVFSTMLLAVLLLLRMMESARRFNILPYVTIVTSKGYTTVKTELDKIKDDPFMNMDNQSQSNISNRYKIGDYILISLFLS
jgi:NAD(P)-dependent dehydrogenase (short-subunit alcohol dehydrogenase family)